MKKLDIKKMIKEEIEFVLEDFYAHTRAKHGIPVQQYKKEKFTDEYSFDKILPKKSKYKFKLAVNNIVDALEDNDVEYTDIKKYIHVLVDMAFKSDSHPIFRDY